MTNRRTHWLAGCILGLTTSFATAEAAPRTSVSAAEIQRMIVREAESKGIPPELALAVAKVESGFNPRALSSAGARGVMQIMPKTARDVYQVSADQLWDPALNIRLGIDFLADLIRRYGRVEFALSHYNGGSRVGAPPNSKVIPATRKYVDAVLALQKRYRGEGIVATIREGRTWQVAQSLPSPVAEPPPRPVQAGKIEGVEIVRLFQTPASRPAAPAQPAAVEREQGGWATVASLTDRRAPRGRANDW